MHFDSIFTDRVAEMEYAWLPLKNDAKDFQKKVALKKGTYYIKVVRASKKSNASGFYDVRCVCSSSCIEK